MNLFRTKYDFKKSPLRLEFDPTTRQYVYYYGTKKIPYNDLNKKTQKELTNKNNHLLENPNLLHQLLENEKIKKQMNYLKSIGYPCNSFEYLGPIEGTMSGKMTSFLNHLTSKENVLIGIHRTGNITKENLELILTHGLSMTSHSGSGAFTCPHLSNNVSYYANNKTIIKEIMYADHYKNSTGSILIEIPYKDLETNSIYIEENGNKLLHPRYILGYIPIEENHYISQIITAKDLKNESMKSNVHTSELNYPNYNEIGFKKK